MVAGSRARARRGGAHARARVRRAQDLPNFAQNQVPIFSLPIEWLWCESWCSEESKASAKTIDLCNNPMFKEPKLDMARRVVNGPLFEESWVQLDEEVRSVEDQSSA